MLTNKIIDGAKPRALQYKLTDGHGLFIAILPSGSKSWRCNYKLEGKHKSKTFGLYPAIGLAAARRLNMEFKALLARGIEKPAPSFDEVKRLWYKQKLPTLKNIKHKQQIIYRLDNFVSPYIGKTPINALKRIHLVEVVQRVQAGKVIETAHRVAMHMRQVFDYAVDMGVIEHHSAAGLSRVLQKPKTTHMPCVDLAEAPKLVRDIEAIDNIITRCALKLLLLTFTRSVELRYMRWTEIKDKRFWVIPGERMKLGLPHVVPLSDEVLKILEALKPLTGDFEYVLHSPNRPNKPVSENFFLDALYRLGYRGKMTAHGFRSLASTVLNEQSGFKPDVIERQLAHREKDEVRKAYNRAQYLDERVKLMDWWTAWVLKINAANCVLGLRNTTLD